VSAECLHGHRCPDCKTPIPEIVKRSVPAPSDGGIKQTPKSILDAVVFALGRGEDVRGIIERALAAKDARIAELEAERDEAVKRAEAFRSDAYENALKAEKWMAEATRQATERDKNYAMFRSEQESGNNLARGMVPLVDALQQIAERGADRDDEPDAFKLTRFQCAQIARKALSPDGKEQGQEGERRSFFAGYSATISRVAFGAGGAMCGQGRDCNARDTTATEADHHHP
jgi:hypothetical protein